MSTPDSPNYIDDHPLDPTATRKLEEQTKSKAGAEATKGHPWTKLPPELLVEVFKQATSDPRASTPFQLGRICRTWRNIVFTTPELWSRLELEFDPVHYCAQIELLEQCLQRVVDLPLSLNLGCTPRFETLLCQGKWKKEYGRKLIDVIGRKSDQISFLKMVLPVEFFSSLSGSQTTWAALTELIVWVPPNLPTLYFEPSPMRVFERSFQLQKFVVHRFYISVFSLPWAYLLHLEIKVVAPFEICDALTWCPNLQTLCTRDVVEATEERVFGVLQSQAPQVVNHFKLEQLTFSSKKNEEEDASYAYAMEAFDKLRLFALKNLHLNFEGRTVDMALYPFMLYPLFSRSHLPIQELTIHSTRLSQSDLIACLRLSPTLRHLTLTDNAWVDSYLLGPEMFELMALSHGQDSILPDLESLVFLQGLRREEISFAPTTIIKFLESRWGTPGLASPKPSSLRTLTFGTIGPQWEITIDHKSIFDSWIAMGYAVSVFRKI